MKWIVWLALTLGFCSLSFTNAYAENSSVLTSATNQARFFMGIGGSYNALHVNGHAQGILNAVSGFPPNGVFSADGNSFHKTQYAASPQIQMGVIQHVTDSHWLWGLKFLYQYLQANNAKARVYLDYVGMANVNDQITANAVQTSIKHEFAGMVLIGHSFKNGFVYLAVGPSLSEVENSVTHLNDTLSGYYIAKMKGFSNQSQWLLGGLLQLGVTYYVNPTWFVDLNYTYTAIEKTSIDNFDSFSPARNGGLNAGVVSFDTSKQISSQALMISINKVFS